MMITKSKIKNRVTEEEFQNVVMNPPMWVYVLNHIGFSILIWFSFLRDFVKKYIFTKTKAEKRELDDMEDFVGLYISFENFFVRNVADRVRDVIYRPICTSPGPLIDIIERDFNQAGEMLGYTGKIIRNVVNLGSYNYLGFAENKGCCAESAIKTANELGVGVCSSRIEVGNLKIHETLERTMARFLGVEDCITFGMGFATNSMNIPCLVNKGCLVLSDSCNHASLALGCKISGAKIQIFKHNDMEDLERILRKLIIEGQPRTHRPWKKILIIVEGIYSMEGTIVNLPEVIKLKKKYKAYLYLDEAHSIGALGKNAKGVTDYFNIDPNDVDILMGTFTKSFGACGGYIAGKKYIIEYLKQNSHACTYAVAMSPPVAQQAISSLRRIASKDGEIRIKKLAENTRIFRNSLKREGFLIFGSDDSPVIPLLAYLPTHIGAFTREMLAKGFGVVVAGYPSTPIAESRVRFCMSSALSSTQIYDSLKAVSEVGDILCLKYFSS